jgi:hypothetical protein
MLAAANTGDRQRANRAEYLAPLIALLLGAHLMAMSTGLLMLLPVTGTGFRCLHISLQRTTATPRPGGRHQVPAFRGDQFGRDAVRHVVAVRLTGSLNFTDPAFYESLSGLPRLPLLVSLFLTLGGTIV